MSRLSSIVELAYRRECAHRAVPWPVSARLIERMADKEWERDAELREQARWHMSFVVGNSERASEIDELSRLYVRQAYLRIERRWRPWTSLKSIPSNTDQLVTLQRSGRGVLLNFIHLGDHLGAIGAIGRVGITVHSAAHPDFVVPNATREARQCMRVLTRHGGAVFNSAGSREHIRTLLHAGQIVALASDMTGSMPMNVLGREVRAASGASRLALETRAWVVPMTVHHDDLKQWAVIEDPIDPDDFSDVEAMQAEIGRRHEPALLAWPEAFERPLRRWRPTPDSRFGWTQTTSFKI